MNDKKTENTVHGLRILAVIMLIVCAVTVSLCYLVSSKASFAVLGEEKVPASVSLAPAVSTSPTAAPMNVSNSNIDLNGRVTFPGFSSLSAKINDDGIAELSSQLFNPEENEGKYYFIFEIRLINLDGSFKTIYSSDKCYSGVPVCGGKLEGSFAEGTYNIVLHLQPYRISDDTPTNNSEQIIKLYIR